MSSRYLACPGCRIRVRENARDIDLLEGMCPICGKTLRSTSATSVIGSRLFDLEPLSDGVGALQATARPADPAIERGASVALDDRDAQRSHAESGSLSIKAVAPWPARR